MASLAFARPCSKCATLVTFSGGYPDHAFMAQCPCCGAMETYTNPQYAGPALELETTPRESAIASLHPDDREILDKLAGL